MQNKSNLPYLVKLIDDDNVTVREEVIKSLTNYGINLEEDLIEFTDFLDDDKLDIINPILQQNRKEWLIREWPNWQLKLDDYDQIECALNLIAKYQYGLSHVDDLSKLLDALADEFILEYPYGNEIDLSNFLFHFKEFKGDKQNYYNPLNSNLIYVIKNKKGLPISLACIYMLVAHRLNLRVEGCNFPGHFLVRTFLDDEKIFIDCYNSGKILYETDFESLTEDSYESILHLLNLYVSPKTIIQRTINNLINAYKNNDDNENSTFFNDLLKNYF
ncbi:MAG: transglutaminase family protein [Ignavibacteria bacterium]|jgi:hypothetical protein